MVHELLNPSDSDPLKLVTIESENQLISKVYDRKLHDFYFILERIESFSFHNINITDSRVAIQLQVIKDFSIKATARNQQHQVKEFHFSTAYSDASITNAQQIIPLVIDLGKWHTLVFDFDKLMNAYCDTAFYSLDSLTLSSSESFIRKIYALPKEDCAPPALDYIENVIFIESVPDCKKDDIKEGSTHNDNYNNYTKTDILQNNEIITKASVAILSIEHLRAIKQKLNKIENDFIKEYGKIPF